MDNPAVPHSSAPGASRHRWDVFLSFRGEDTRHPFTFNLYNALEKQGVRVFRDDEGLRRGEEIAPGLIEAIEDSAASIVIISPNYASSRWCLQELSKIYECRRLILPVFYRVYPSDVRKQAGPFAEHFKKHEDRFGKEEVSRWREAMKKAGDISGWVFYHSNEEQEGLLIRELVKRVLTELANTPVGVVAYPVGLDSRIGEVMSLLDVRSNGVRVLGLYGMGGIGKTTLAKALFNKLVGRFERLSFIPNVRETLANGDLISLQNKLINDLSPGVVHVYSAAAIEEAVHEKRVLIVLDDIDDASHLDRLIGRREWFSEGSKIIITTRDREVLAKCSVNSFYEVRELRESEALTLFSYHALRREKPTDILLDLSKRMVSLTGGLPLALEVFGSFLFDKRRVEEWKDALKKLEQIRPSNLQDILKISYDGLDTQERCIFLDIACLFIPMGMEREEAIDILKGCGFSAEIAIRNLTAKSLVKITHQNALWMHDQVRDMGRQIVLDDSPVDLGRRSRLWQRDAIMTVLEGQKGTEFIQGIVLDFNWRPRPQDRSGDEISWENFKRAPNVTSALTYLEERYKKHLQNKAEKEREVVLHAKSLESMDNLRLLQINSTRLAGRCKNFPAQLKWLQWRGCPLKSLPSDFCPRELAVLDLSESKIQQVWSASKKVPKKLMVMNLRGCCNLSTIPDLSGHQTLEKLVLERCLSLTKIHESVGNMSKLFHLNLRDCQNLVEFPADVSGLRNLENLVLSGCSKLKELPNDIGSMRSLKELLVDDTAIAILPESIFRLSKLEKLSLVACKYLKRLPNCLGKLSSLKRLSLNHSGIEEIPDSIGSLENLENLGLMSCASLASIPDTVGKLISLTELLANGNKIQELPASIGSLSYLKDLSVGNCRSLSKLPDSIGGLASIVELHLDGTPITNLPDQIGALKMLRKLEMRNCKELACLPESIGSLLGLTSLNMYNASISELPGSVGMLENLIRLNLNKCTQLHKLPNSIGGLKSLQNLLMEETAVTELPESFGMLSSLMTLQMSKHTFVQLTGNSAPEEVVIATAEEKPNAFKLPMSFPNLCSLEEFDARAWKLCGEIPDDFEKLASLKILNLGYNNITSLPSSLTGLSFLEKLLLSHCKELESLPPLPSSLVEVNVANCRALERVADLSNLENLSELNLTNCAKVVDIPGLESLKSLRRLFMSGCKGCSSVVKRRLSKVCLRNMRSLAMPGSRIPDWFSSEVIFSESKNRAIKGVIIGLVVSVNRQMPDDQRDRFSYLPGIRARILKMDSQVFSTMLDLKGIPKTDEDHIYLFRFPAFRPLVFQLKDGYKIEVTEQDPPYIEGLEVKKRGIYLIFEGDDDYEGNEESLDENQLSISEKLAKFFCSLEEDGHISGSGHDVISQAQEIEEQEARENGSFSRGIRQFVRGWSGFKRRKPTATR